MSKSQEEWLTPELKQQLFRLLGNPGQEAVTVDIRHLEYGGDLWVSRTDLVAALTALGEESISDQKQEAYRGLRLLLSKLRSS